MSKPNPLYPVELCGCKRIKVFEGTRMEGWLQSYCNAHNPYKSIVPRVNP